jgi:hypothetical protein
MPQRSQESQMPSQMLTVADSKVTLPSLVTRLPTVRTIKLHLPTLTLKSGTPASALFNGCSCLLSADDRIKKLDDELLLFAGSNFTCSMRRSN